MVETFHQLKQARPATRERQTANLKRGDEKPVQENFLNGNKGQSRETVAITKALEPEERAAAEKRMAEGARLGPAIRDGKVIPVEIFHRDTGKTRDKVARYVGVSGPSRRRRQRKWRSNPFP